MAIMACPRRVEVMIAIANVLYGFKAAPPGRQPQY
ncbi:hypothetical protein UG55_10103 [Frankia sp. EI5c]|nr:hypothetical protein UG55_10103 [Frankia sp. EI5c]